MNCEKFSNLIDDLVEGELDGQTAEQINLHIFSCSECASQFKKLKREKEIYSRYLFEIEPPFDLQASFAKRLESEQKTLLAAQTSFSPTFWAAQMFGFIRFNPALAVTVALILFAVAFGLISLLTEKQTFEKAHNAVQADLQKVQLMFPQIVEKENEPVAVDTKKAGEVEAKSEKRNIEISPKTIALKQTIVKKTQVKPKNPAETVKLSEEEQLQIKLIQNLEIETARQLEKVELLLRSFRNVRFVEGSEMFDISYEKQQARKLLAKNIELRQRAESYGTLFTEEMLSKVEPYLLEIANLESSPSLEKVLEIKERVRNQNIIASLQGF